MAPVVFFPPLGPKSFERVLPLKHAAKIPQNFKFSCISAYFSQIFFHFRRRKIPVFFPIQSGWAIIQTIHFGQFFPPSERGEGESSPDLVSKVWPPYLARCCSATTGHLPPLGTTTKCEPHNQPHTTPTQKIQGPRSDHPTLEP